MAKTRLVPVRLTVVADEDVEAIRQHLPFTRRREIRVRRLAHEAHRQGAAFTEADLALLMGNCSGGLVSGVVTRLRKTGEWLPLRGYVADMGSFPTHKAAIFALYLEGLTTPDIAARTYHSKEAVDRYIRGFDRVRLLAPKFAPEELPLLTGMSMPLVQQYLDLFRGHGVATTRASKEARHA